MSMILGLVAVGDADIDRLLADPVLVWRVVSPDNPELYQQARKAAAQPSFFGRLFRGNKAPAPADGGPGAADLAFDAAEGLRTDLEKSWHGIHYLLTGTAWEGDPPLNFLVLGGRVVGDIDVGYGPPHALTAAETGSVSDALARVGDEELRGRFDPAAMMKQKIYPEIWDRGPDEDDTLGYLMENVGVLREFLAQVVGRNQGLVVYIS
jgi:hypothetical protein